MYKLVFKENLLVATCEILGSNTLVGKDSSSALQLCCLRVKPIENTCWVTVHIKQSFLVLYCSRQLMEVTGYEAWPTSRRKQRHQNLCWKLHNPAQSFVCPHTLCMNYVTNAFLLVSSSVWSKQLLCFVFWPEK